jgi:MoaA/NifB/PqqE/SkfB family radical SAM enzyme
LLSVEAQITGCQCACDHCCVYGYKSNFNLNLEEIEFILRNMKEYSNENFLFPLFDVTNHPQFLEILKLSNEYGIQRDILSVNGIHDFTDGEFKEMKAIGITYIQIAFHGIGERHDKFVHHEGAYDKLISLIDKGGKLGFKFSIILFVNKQNIGEIQRLANILKDKKLVMGEDFWVVTYQYYGRAMKLGHLQFTKGEFEKHEFKDNIFMPNRSTESEWLKKVTQDEWKKPAFIYDNSNLDLHIDKYFNVYFKDYNPYYFNGLPAAEDGFKLGNLKNESLIEIMKRVDNERPLYIKALENISIPQLAKMVGKENDILYTANDVPKYKWVYEFLRRKCLL